VAKPLRKHAVNRLEGQATEGSAEFTRPFVLSVLPFGTIGVDSYGTSVHLTRAVV